MANRWTLSKAVISHIESIGFSKIDNQANVFYGRLRSTVMYDPYFLVLTVVPLRHNDSFFMFSCTYNGQELFTAKLGTLDDLKTTIKWYGVVEDIQIWRQGNAQKKEQSK